MQSKFWKYIENLGGVDGFWDKYNEDRLIGPETHMKRASELLFVELPSAAEWPLEYLVSLLIDLASGPKEDAAYVSPKTKQYDPNCITLHSGEGEFRRVLFQNPPRGAITFVHDMIGGMAAFSQPAQRERLVTFVRGNKGGLYYEDGTPSKVDGAVLGFIRGKRIDLYLFPQNWAEIVEDVRDELDKMTAEEKASVELPYELKAFVDLLGWEMVNNELQKLRV